MEILLCTARLSRAGEDIFDHNDDHKWNRKHRKQRKKEGISKNLSVTKTAKTSHFPENSILSDPFGSRMSGVQIPSLRPFERRRVSTRDALRRSIYPATEECRDLKATVPRFEPREEPKVKTVQRTVFRQYVVTPHL